MYASAQCTDIYNCYDLFLDVIICNFLFASLDSMASGKKTTQCSLLGLVPLSNAFICGVDYRKSTIYVL